MASAPVGSGMVAVAGSRALPPQASALVAAVCRSLVAAGCSLVVGCSAGADAAVLGCALALPRRGIHAARVRCLAAFGPVSPPFLAPSGRYSAPGAWSGSAVREVAEFLLAGGSVSWWAGGGSPVPLSARLAARTRAVVGQASVGCVVFFASPGSRGSLLAARCAVERGLPVFAFPVGFLGSALPSLGAGSWAPFSGAGVWSSAWLWVGATPRIF